MRFKILSAAFLMGVYTTPLLAQPIPPSPPPQQTCENTSDSLCVDAAHVYNAIIASPAVPATQAFADMVAALQGQVDNPKREGTYLYSSINLYHQHCSSDSTSHSCVHLWDALGYVVSILSYIQTQMPLPSQTQMTQLVTTQGKMSQLNPTPFYDFVYSFNALHKAITAVSSTSSSSKTQKPSPARAAPTSGSPASPQKGAVSSKK